MPGDLAVAGRERDRRVKDRDTGSHGLSTSDELLMGVPVFSMTVLTASCSTPPSAANSFRYPISTSAVLLGSKVNASDIENHLVPTKGGLAVRPRNYHSSQRALAENKNGEAQ